MNYQDQVLALFGEANPVSDLDTLEDFVSPRLEAVEQRTGQMTETKVRDTDQNRPIVKKEWWRGLAYGLAAAAGVLLIGAVTWIAFRNDGGPDVASAPVDIGLSFIEARNAWDSEAAIVLFAPDAVVDGLVTQVEDFGSSFAFQKAIGTHLLVEECIQTAVDPPVEVTCTYTYENAWTQALGVGPFSGSSFGFVIANGLIEELSNNFDSSDFSGQVWEVFRDWVRDTHLENLNVMYDFSNPANDVPRVTPEAVALWEQYTNEFVSSVTDSGTP